jgi:hypothetical protein
MAATSRRLWLITGSAATALFLAIQLVPYGRDHTNPPVVSEPVWNASATRGLAESACFDCHSHLTKWPAYAQVAPVSWLIAHDVAEGREHLNMSDWQRPQEEAHEAAEVVRNGEMPPLQYRLLHPEARLSAGEREQLARGLALTFAAGPEEEDDDAAVPSSLVIEHGDLQATLRAIADLPRTTGMAARYVAELMDDHFKSEEEFAMPPLALLHPLAEGQDMQRSARAAITMSDRLKTDWPRMLGEHESIREALSVLAVEARVENRPEVLRFVETLKLHAQQEEEILYPAAILVGEYLKLRGSR